MYIYFLSIEAKEDLKPLYNYGVAKFGINLAVKYFNMIRYCFNEF